MKASELRSLGISEARNCEKRFEIVVHGETYRIAIYSDMMPAEPHEDLGSSYEDTAAAVERSRQRVGVALYSARVSMLEGNAWHDLAYGMRSKTVEGTVNEALRKVVAHAEYMRANAPKVPTQ